MKVLLIGEYSRFHNSLKEGLQALGHEVTLVGGGDDFKNYPVDIDISPSWSNKNWLTTKLRRAFFRLTKVDIALIETGWRFWKQRSKLQGHDVVQLINSWSIRTTFEKEKQCIDFLSKNNKAVFLSACGTDTDWVKSLLSDDLPYNLLTPYITKKAPATSYKEILKYLTEEHVDLYAFAKAHSKSIIPTDMDYYLGLSGKEKVNELLPTPINLEKLEFQQPSLEGKVVIFHGINRMSYLKKGNDVFEKALAIIRKKQGDIIEIITVESLPYTAYIKAYDKAHILLDQVYSHDQGYNALEAMAKGKVVFTGAGKHFMEHYNLSETVAIDATPNPVQIANELEQLILDKTRLLQIGKNAHAFVNKHHQHVHIAERYIDIWKKS